AVAEAERRTAAALERVARVLEGLAGKLAAGGARLGAEAGGGAVGGGGQVPPPPVAPEPLLGNCAPARGCFAHLVTAPHVVVRVSEALHAHAREQLEQAARMNGFEGRLVVLAEPEIAPGDCRIEWADGGVVRDRAATEAAILEAVNRYAA